MKASLSGLLMQKTLKSIFNRKGGDGLYTKIIKNSNSELPEELANNLLSNEDVILFSYVSNFEWFFLSDLRLVVNYKSQKTIIDNSSITDIAVAVQDEFEKKVYRKDLFTTIDLHLTDKSIYKFSVEADLPYWGVLNVLRFICFRK